MTALATPPKLQFLDSNGAPLVGGKLYTYAAGTTTPQASYTDYGGGTPNANPVILDSRGEASVWLDTALYKMALYSATNVLIWTVDNIGGFATLAQLAASGGAALIGYLPAGSGAVATTVQAKLRESVSVKDFGAVGDGVADDTAAIQAAIDYAASLYSVVSGYPRGGIQVFIPQGAYKCSGLILKNGVSLRGEGNYKTLILMTSNGGTLFKNASATSQLSADSVYWNEYSNFSFIPDPSVTFSSPTVLWNMTGFARSVFRNLGTAFKGNVTSWQLIGATLASSGGPTSWYNDFYDIFTEGTATGGIGWDLGDTLATKEQFTTWNWYGGRTSGNAGTGTGMKINSATGVNLYGHVFENLSDELLIGSPSGTRGCLEVNLFGCYFEGSNNGYTIYPNATNIGLIKCFATGVTNTDNGVQTTIINNSEMQFPVNNVANAFNLIQANAANKPQIKGSTAPGWRLNNAAGNWLDIFNGAATSSATDYFRVDDVIGRTLIKSGSSGTQFYGTQFSFGNQNAVSLFIGTGTPEAAVTASVGSLFMRTNGGAGTSLYVKESGTGNTGWVGK